MVLSRVAEAKTRESDVKQWEEDFKDTLTKEPGLKASRVLYRYWRPFNDCSAPL